MSHEGDGAQASNVILETQIIHDGFFHPQAPPIDVDGLRFHHVHVVGLPLSVMFCRVRVSRSPAESVEHLVVYANHPRLGDDVVAEVDRVLARSFPALTVSFTRDVDTGRAQVSCFRHAPDAGIAGAVAVVLTVCGWDESDPIVVSVADEVFAVSMAYDDRWRARVSCVSRGG